MRKVVLIIVMVLLPTVFFGQSVLDKFNSQDDVSSVIINKRMFELMGKMAVDSTDKETLEYQGLVKKLEILKVYSTTSKRATSEMKTAYDKYLKSAKLEELIRVNENGGSMKIAIRPADNKIRELLMFMEGDSDQNPTVLMSLTGSFDLNEISTLTDRMQIPGSEELKGATKQKL